MQEVAMRSIVEEETLEIPKHRKKKQSATSNARNKQKHKHSYKDCLLFDKEKHHKGKYCLICGRIGHVDRIETVKMQGGLRRKLTEKEIREKYKHLESIVVEKWRR